MEIVNSLLSFISSFYSIITCVIPYIAVVTVIAIISTRSKFKQARQFEADLKSGRYDNIQSQKQTRILGCIMLFAVLLMFLLAFGFVIASFAYYLGYLPTNETILKYLQIAFIIGLLIAIPAGIIGDFLIYKTLLGKNSKITRGKDD